MASHQDFVDYVAEQLREAGTIRSRKMFGEYGLYCDGVFFAVICGDQFFGDGRLRSGLLRSGWPDR